MINSIYCSNKVTGWIKLGGSEEEHQNCTLTLQRRYVPIVPAYDPLKDKPKATLMHARVVGEKGETVYVDEWSRIKVRYVYTRSEDNSHDSGAASNDNDSDSAWVEVLTSFAGAGFGARYLPRVNELVLIDHIGGDIDRPIVIGRVHEAERFPAKFDNKGKLPDTRYLSGVRTEEIKSSGFNQLRFDDTTGQISAQLQSSHAATQLNLGKLSHPKETEKSDDRGEGFELRTDKWGAVRAGEGLLLTTYAQDQASGEQMAAEEVRKQLENSHNNSKELSKIAKNQQTDELESIEQIKAFADQIQKDIAKLNSAILLMSSPEDIGLSSCQNIHLSADGQINQIAGDSVNISTQKSLIAQVVEKISLFAVKFGIRIFAAQGKIELQAQNDGIEAIARKKVKIISTEDEVIIQGKRVLIQTGDALIDIGAHGIREITDKLYENKAGQQQFKSGGKVNVEFPQLKETICIPCLLSAALHASVFIDK